MAVSPVDNSLLIYLRVCTETLTAVRPKDSTPLHWKDTRVTMEENRSSSNEDTVFKDQNAYSYQQISCLDSVVRYLESCNVPISMKRKCQSSSNTASSNSDEDKQKGPHSMQVSEEPALLKNQSSLSALEDHDKKSRDAATAVVGTSLPLSVPNKPESVVSITSHHERESYKKLGLTKQVLAAHTQKEEQTFLYRFKEHRGLTALKENCSQYLERQREQIASYAIPAAQSSKQDEPSAEPTARRGTRNKKTKSKRAKQMESSDSTVSHHRQQHLRPPLLTHGLNLTSWSSSDTSQSNFPMAYPSVMPGYPLPVYPRANSMAPRTDATNQGFVDNQGTQPPPCPQPIHPAPFTTPMVTPIVALILPMPFSPLAPSLQSPQPVFHAATAGFPTQMQPFSPVAFPVPVHFAASPSFTVQSQFNSPNHFALQSNYIPSAFYFPPVPETSKAPVVESQSRSSTPQSGGGGGPASPTLFQSRCSLPLNLLELELCVDRQDCTALSSGGQGNNMAEWEMGASGNRAKEREMKQPSLSLLGAPGPLYCEGSHCVCDRLSWDKVCSRRSCSKETSSRGDGNNSDSNSFSSDMLDIILHEDSADSGSMGSGSNGCGTSASGTSNSRTSNSRTSNSGTSKSRTSASGTSGSGKGSNNSSNYFGSVDSSQISQKVKGHLNGSDSRPLEMDQSEHFITDIQRVLRDDREKLRLLQKSQPSFSEEQKKELMEVHTWIKRGGLPKEIDIKVCSCCNGASEAAAAQRWRRNRQTLTSVKRRRWRRAASGGPERNPPTLSQRQPARQQTHQDLQSVPYYPSDSVSAQL
ncbi:hypothetical protein F7725_011443 [Dissostichus mawsoni]|uniref:Period circadian-like C-terminal domain-containing protein n=1 Tax=Dissostichus mawsoni TaxID=36200 RepID=A0A7J5Z8V0_DISMA|nr:hypothetical protein F7725_011443 [Dissostichus mawsoni]